MVLFRSIVVLSVAAASVLQPLPARACTAFAATTPRGTLVAKSFEWRTGEGWAVLNERGRMRAPLVPGRAGWTARFASLSFTTVAPGFPVSGLNEAGLVIESLVDFSIQPERAPRAGTLTGLEFVQYALDKFASVDELAEFAAEASFSQLGVGLHFFACERSGRCAVLESGARGVRVTRLPREQGRALANEPVADDRAAHERSWLPSWLGGLSPGGSAARYHTVVARVGAVQTSEDAFALLARLRSQATRWQLVWDMTRGSVQFHGERARGSLRVEPDLHCAGTPRVLSLDAVGRDAPFGAWSTGDARRAEASIMAQLGSAGAGPRRLAAAVVHAAGSSRCATLE
jgi:choloylglycine hydrolase